MNCERIGYTLSLIMSHRIVGRLNSADHLIRELHTSVITYLLSVIYLCVFATTIPYWGQ